MGWFFTKAALLTFGGAYAVLPYVYQGAVDTHQWLSAAQMIDGLALGETTPGPLIMVVAFVGFVGGWSPKQVFGPEALFLGGALAATVVTCFTFLPSFVFILAGGPLVGVHARQPELHRAADGHHRGRGRRDPEPGAVLRATTCCGRRASAGRFDAVSSALIALAAAVALFRFKRGVMPLLAACAVVGLAASTGRRTEV